MRLSQKIPTLILGGLGLLLTVWVLVANQTLTDFRRLGLADRQAAQLRELQRAVDDIREVSLARAELLAGWRELAVLTRDADHDRLLDRVTPVYAVQNRRYWMDQLDFFTLKGTVVLRASAPKEYGDTVLQDRPLAAAVLRSRVPQAAVGVTRTGPAHAAVAPMLLDGKPVGLVHVGIATSRLVRRVNAETGSECAAFFDRMLLLKRAPEFARQLPVWQVLGPYHGVEGTDWPMILDVLSGEVKGTIPYPRTFISRQPDGLYSAALLPMRDQRGEPVGLLVSVNRAETIGDQVTQLATPLAAGLALVAILGSALVLVVCNGFLVRPVRDLAQRLEALGKGEAPPPAEDLVHRKDEVGTLARAYETLRQGPPEA